MTNPENAVGTNAAYNGRTSVNAFNDVLASLTRGLISGWECKPSTGMIVMLGGNGTTRDVAVAEDNAGNRTTINNISGSPVPVTIAAAPGANSRIDAIVGYVDNPAMGAAETADNPSSCGLIAVSGTTASVPSAPDDGTIRSAITSDGANGTSAYYVILATIKVTTGLTTITGDNIISGDHSKLVPGSIDSNNIGKGTVKSDNVDWETLGEDIQEIKRDESSFNIGKSMTTIAEFTANKTGMHNFTAYLADGGSTAAHAIDFQYSIDGVKQYNSWFTSSTTQTNAYSGSNGFSVWVKLNKGQKISFAAKYSTASGGPATLGIRALVQLACIS